MNVPTEAVIRKAVSEYMNEYVVSTSWITNVFYCSDMGKKAITAKHIKGFVQSLTVDPWFYMNLHSEKQLKAIGKL
jgi:hypothetical protein